MNKWMFNDGSYKHRGVWHVVPEFRETVVPETRREYDHEIHIYHQSKCQWAYSRDGKVRVPSPERLGYSWTPYIEVTPICSCKLKTEAPWKTIGTYKVIDVKPEHSVFRGSAICGQVDMKTGGLKWMSFYSKKHKPGMVYEKVSPVVRPEIYEGDDIPPGPYCSRCAKKVGLI